MGPSSSPRNSEFVDDGNLTSLSGLSNPADAVSRGSSAAVLSSNRLWRDGPSWLVEASDAWPVTRVDEPTLEESQLIARETKKVTIVVERVVQVPVFQWDRYSSWSFLCKVAAWMRRACSQHSSSPATAPEDFDEVPVPSGEVRVRRLDGAEVAAAEFGNLK